MYTLYIGNKRFSSWSLRAWALMRVRATVAHDGYELTPSEMFHRQCYFNGWFDTVAPFAGYFQPEHILWSTNLPVATSTWPRTQDAIERCFAGVSADARKKILWDNAASLYKVQPTGANGLAGEGIFARRYDAGGNPLTRPARIETGLVGPGVAVDGRGSFSIAWTKSLSSVIARRCSAMGAMS